jgi:predicted transcriptional regulator
MIAVMDNRPRPALDEIAAALDSSEADILAGRVVPADEVDRMIRKRIDRTEARLSAGRSFPAATPRR